MLYACALFLGFITLVALVVLAVAARDRIIPGFRPWTGRIARGAVFFTVANYLFNGRSSVTEFLAEVSVAAVILWVVAVLVDTRVGKTTAQDQVGDRNNNQNLY